MELTVAAWNIEKNGKSSTEIKQARVNEFIDRCCKELNLHIIFLSEMHSAQIPNYLDFLPKVYENYNVYSFYGGYSNGYILLIRKDIEVKPFYDVLKGLNRKILLLNIENFYLILAHFKSGQTALTKSQLINAANWLESIPTKKWCITGDMNWDYSRYPELNINAIADPYTCWRDETQAKGGILDWCLAGKQTNVTPMDLTKIFESEMFDMDGPDHKPIIFKLNF